MRRKTGPKRRNRAFWIDPRVLDSGVRSEVESIRAVDTHEHLFEESVRLKEANNLSRFFMFYAFDQMAVAGMKPEDEGRFFQNGIAGEEQWRLIRNAWPLARHTGYCRSVSLSTQEIYQIPDLDDRSVPKLLEAVAKRNRPGVQEETIRDICNLECCLMNAEDPGDLARRTENPGLFLFDISVAPFCSDNLDLTPYEKASGINCDSLKDWYRLIDFYFERWGRQAVAIKNQCAYWRVLKFDDVPESQAAPLFEKWLVRKEDVTPAEKKAVQDHLFHSCIQRAMECDLPVKIHTGYLAGHNYMEMDLFRVRNLTNLFRKYPRARFDIFHISYPEWPDLVALSQHYSNVYADMCWAWAIDPEASMQFARQMLVAAPSNKVFWFGGDNGFADVVYGAQRIARDGISMVLTEAVREGRLTRVDAKAVARRWLRENAFECFRIEARRAAQAKGQPAPLQS